MRSLKFVFTALGMILYQLLLPIYFIFTLLALGPSCDYPSVGEAIKKDIAS